VIHGHALGLDDQKSGGAAAQTEVMIDAVDEQPVVEKTDPLESAPADHGARGDGRAHPPPGRGFFQDVPAPVVVAASDAIAPAHGENRHALRLRQAQGEQVGDGAGRDGAVLVEGGQPGAAFVQHGVGANIERRGDAEVGAVGDQPRARRLRGGFYFGEVGRAVVDDEQRPNLAPDRPQARRKARVGVIRHHHRHNRARFVSHPGTA
jgi:hypothetical protein